MESTPYRSTDDRRKQEWQFSLAAIFKATVLWAVSVWCATVIDPAMRLPLFLLLLFAVGGFAGAGVGMLAGRVAVLSSAGGVLAIVGFFCWLFV
jgi:hypothetical protein